MNELGVTEVERGDQVVSEVGWDVKLMLISLDRKGASGPVTRVALAMMRRGGDDTGPDSTNKQKSGEGGHEAAAKRGKRSPSSAFIKRPHSPLYPNHKFAITILRKWGQPESRCE